MVRNQAWLAPGAMETCANQLQAAPARLSASPCRNVQHSNRLASAPWAPAQLAQPDAHPSEQDPEARRVGATQRGPCAGHGAELEA